MFHSIESSKLTNKAESFPYPYYYFPTSVARYCAKLLMEKIPIYFPSYSFGLKDDESIGKMFGVLVVRNNEGELGYLQAFSGRIGETSLKDEFVPPVFDFLEKDGYFRKKESEISELNNRVAELKLNSKQESLKITLGHLRREGRRNIDNLIDFNKRAKAQRKRIRDSIKDLPLSEASLILKELRKESQKHHFQLKDLKKKVQKEQKVIIDELKNFEQQINSLKKKRSTLSNDLQNWIFKQYTFKNFKGEKRDLLDLFENTALGKPPSGAGDCAAPKLLHYASLHGFQPITMAEFWFGASPSGLQRNHKKYYPACRGKCQPILNFVLQGIDVQENQLISQCKKELELEIIFEDQYLIAVNKPSGILSVPGREIQESVYKSIAKNYSKLFAIHRLDMATSGILLFAKDEVTYKQMQSMFAERSVKKTYEAILDVSPKIKNGEVNFPIAPSYLNRPMQMYDLNGKEALTKYEVIKESEIGTHVLFFPKTGRTHQLRIHAAHYKGLSSPIKGDVLYGNPEKRLYLHASSLEFEHPSTKEKIIISCPSDFF